MQYQEWVKNELGDRFGKAYKTRKEMEGDALIGVLLITDPNAICSVHDDKIQLYFRRYKSKCALATIACRAFTEWGRQNNDNHK